MAHKVVIIIVTCIIGGIILILLVLWFSWVIYKKRRARRSSKKHGFMGDAQHKSFTKISVIKTSKRPKMKISRTRSADETTDEVTKTATLGTKNSRPKKIEGKKRKSIQESTSQTNDEEKKVKSGHYYTIPDIEPSPPNQKITKPNINQGKKLAKKEISQHRIGAHEYNDPHNITLPPKLESFSKPETSVSDKSPGKREASYNAKRKCTSRLTLPSQLKSTQQPQKNSMMKKVTDENQKDFMMKKIADEKQNDSVVSKVKDENQKDSAMKIFGVQKKQPAKEKVDDRSIAKKFSEQKKQTAKEKTEEQQKLTMKSTDNPRKMATKPSDSESAKNAYTKPNNLQ